MALLEHLPARHFMSARSVRMPTTTNVAHAWPRSAFRENRARLHGPVGLPIGSKTPAEIAVAVLAGVTAATPRYNARGLAAGRAGAASGQRIARSIGPHAIEDL
jgi:xanthine dehydrogenase accessory factor